MAAFSRRADITPMLFAPTPCRRRRRCCRQPCRRHAGAAFAAIIFAFAIGLASFICYFPLRHAATDYAARLSPFTPSPRRYFHADFHAAISIRLSFDSLIPLTPCHADELRRSYAMLRYAASCQPIDMTPAAAMPPAASHAVRALPTPPHCQDRAFVSQMPFAPSQAAAFITKISIILRCHMAVK